MPASETPGLPTPLPQPTPSVLQPLGRPLEHADAVKQQKVEKVKKCKAPRGGNIAAKAKASQTKSIKEAQSCSGKSAEIHSCTSHMW